MRPEEIHPLFVNAFNAGDVDAVVSLYEADAVFVSGAKGPMSGRAGIRAVFGALLAARPQMTLITREVTVAGDLTLLRGEWTLGGRRGLSTEVVRRQPDGRWLYVIDAPGVGVTS
ncbi:MAG: YybH family protein [Bryobacteraceae bacterium]